MSRKKLAILVLSRQHSYFDRFASALSADGRFIVIQRNSADAGLEAAGTGMIDAVIVAEELADTSGLCFARRLVRQSPLVHCALVSPLYPQEFHEQTEGLGLLMQLPVNPKTDEAGRFIDVLAKIYPPLAQ